MPISNDFNILNSNGDQSFLNQVYTHGPRQIWKSPSYLSLFMPLVLPFLTPCPTDEQVPKDKGKKKKNTAT